MTERRRPLCGERKDAVVCFAEGDEVCFQCRGFDDDEWPRYEPPFPVASDS
jgi:hypothetical protein